MWHWNMMNQRLKMSHEGAAQVWHFQLSKWETVSLIVVNLKRNEDPRLRRPVRDLTSGASADDFKLYSSTAHNHLNIQWQHHSSIQSTVAAVIHSISILTAIFHSRWTHEKEVAPFMSAFRYETLVEPTRRLKWSGYVTFHAHTVRLCVPLVLQCLAHIIPSVLWHCWLGGRKGIRPVKNWVVGCWCGCLSGARC